METAFDLNGGGNGSHGVGKFADGVFFSLGAVKAFCGFFGAIGIKGNKAAFGAADTGYGLKHYSSPSLTTAISIS
jgi:hypothetical protein